MRLNKTDWEPFAAATGAKLEDLRTYAKGGSLYGWLVVNLEKYDTPSPLAELGLNAPPMSWRYVEIPDAAAEV